MSRLWHTNTLTHWLTLESSAVSCLSRIRNMINRRSLLTFGRMGIRQCCGHLTELTKTCAGMLRIRRRWIWASNISQKTRVRLDRRTSDWTTETWCVQLSCRSANIVLPVHRWKLPRSSCCYPGHPHWMFWIFRIGGLLATVHFERFWIFKPLPLCRWTWATLEQLVAAQTAGENKCLLNIFSFKTNNLLTSEKLIAIPRPYLASSCGQLVHIECRSSSKDASTTKILFQR